MMKACIVVLAIVGILFLGSCSKTCYCSMATLYPAYISFDSTETDTIIVRRYAKNSGFTSLLDTTLLTAQNADYHFKQDTLFVLANKEAATLRSFYDYVLYLPSINRSDSLNDIVETRDTNKGSHNLECNCTNRIVSYALNKDTLATTDAASPHVYIQH